MHRLSTMSILAIFQENYYIQNSTNICWNRNLLKVIYIDTVHNSSNCLRFITWLLIVENSKRENQNLGGWGGKKRWQTEEKTREVTLP